MTERKKQILAASLIILWGGLAFWQWGRWEEPLRVPLTNVTGPAIAGQQPATKGTGTRVKIDLLASADEQRKATFSAPRNIFAVPTPEGTLTVGSGGIDGSHTGAENKQPAAPEKTVQQQMTEAQVAPYRYLGFLRMGDNHQKDMAVLGKDDEVMVLKVGDRVEEQLVLKAITSESVTLQNTATRVKQTVPLSDDTPVEE